MIIKRGLVASTALLLLSSLIFVSASFGIPAQRKAQVRLQVFNLLRGMNDSRRYENLEAIQRLSKSDPAATIASLVEFMDGRDAKIHSRAAWVLVFQRSKRSPQVIKALTSHLRTDADPGVRLMCAVSLMSVDAPEVQDAYIHAVHDQNPKVAQIACGQLGHIGGGKSKDALLDVLSRSPWRVRLEACKALIMMKAADSRVVATLEQMAKEPEAKVYNAEVQGFQKDLGDMKDPGIAKEEMWGTLATITEQAKRNKGF